MMAKTASIPKYTVPDTGSRLAKYLLIVRPRIQSTTVNSVASKKARATIPTASRVAGVARKENRLAIQRAARTVTTNMMGVSISSAVLVPSLGTIQSTRMVPRTKPAANTRAK